MKIAIKGHASRGKEVIQILENLGGINDGLHEGNNPDCYYELHGNIIWCVSTKGINFKYYTLEEFEKEFPFKIGDEVIFPVKVGWESGKVTGLTYVEDQLKYEVYTRIGDYRYVEPHKLSLYPMKKERNITLTLDKAKEWYKKGGELKEIALQAFSEKELNPLPRSWKEFCKQGNPIASWRYSIPTKHEALYQLEQLRDCWRQGWEPDWNDDQQTKYCIVHSQEFKVHILYEARRFLSFPTKEMAEAFIECFRDLIKQAGDLI